MFYRDKIFTTLDNETKRLFDLNLLLIRILIKLIGFEKKLKTTDAYQSVPDNGDFIDLRNAYTPKIKSGEYTFDPYPQVFSEKHGFKEDLSIIDLLFNEGPASIDYLKNGVRSKKV
jgi:hypothetical protein